MKLVAITSPVLKVLGPVHAWLYIVGAGAQPTITLCGLEDVPHWHTGPSIHVTCDICRARLTQASETIGEAVAGERLGADPPDAALAGMTTEQAEAQAKAWAQHEALAPVPPLDAEGPPDWYQSLGQQVRHLSEEFEILKRANMDWRGDFAGRVHAVENDQVSDHLEEFKKAARDAHYVNVDRIDAHVRDLSGADHGNLLEERDVKTRFKELDERFEALEACQIPVNVAPRLDMLEKRAGVAQGLWEDEHRADDADAREHTAGEIQRRLAVLEAGPANPNSRMEELEVKERNLTDRMQAKLYREDLFEQLRPLLGRIDELEAQVRGLVSDGHPDIRNQLGGLEQKAEAMHAAIAGLNESNTGFSERLREHAGNSRHPGGSWLDGLAGRLDGLEAAIERLENPVQGEETEPKVVAAMITSIIDDLAIWKDRAGRTGQDVAEMRGALKAVDDLRGEVQNLLASGRAHVSLSAERGHSGLK